MRTWMKRGIGLGAVLLAVVAATGAYAMWGGDDGDSEPAATRQSNEDTAANPQLASENGGDGGGAFGICIEGTTDCVDTSLNPDDQRNCPEDACSAEADCPPEVTDCGSDLLNLGFSCEPRLTVEECLPDGVPADYECATLESDPVQVKCYPLYCDRSTPPGPAIQDGIDAGEIAACDPPVDPCYPEPQPNARCVPPECAVSSDGSVSCPANEPCDPAVSDCSVPPEAGVVCPDGTELTPEECGTSSSGGGTDGEAPADVEPLPAADR